LESIEEENTNSLRLPFPLELGMLVHVFIIYTDKFLVLVNSILESYNERTTVRPTCSSDTETSKSFMRTSSRVNIGSRAEPLRN
jgi:hypothetical protein